MQFLDRIDLVKFAPERPERSGRGTERGAEDVGAPHDGAGGADRVKPRGRRRARAGRPPAAATASAAGLAAGIAAGPAGRARYGRYSSSSQRSPGAAGRPALVNLTPSMSLR